MVISDKTIFRRAIELHDAGQLMRAEKFYRKAMKAQPNSRDVKFRLGSLLCQQGDYEEAITIFSGLIAAQSGSAAAYFNLGQALNGVGRIADALDAYSKAVKLQPDFTFAHINKIALLKLNQHYNDALYACKQALQYDQKSPELWCHLGDIHREKNNPQLAIQAYQRALTRDNACVEAHHGLGVLYRDSGQFDAAIKQYQQALGIVPGNAVLECGLAAVLFVRGDVEGALECYYRALREHPDDSEIRNNLGCALQEYGRYDEAQVQFESVIGRFPDHQQANINLLNVLSEKGDFGAAQECCKHILHLNPDAAYVSHVLANIKTFSEIDGDVRQMESRLANGAVDDEQRIFLCFALGKIYEDLQNYDRAMRHFTEGNALKRASISYNINDDRRFFTEIQRVFTTDYFSQRKDYGIDSTAPIFVLGMPRSGTSLAEQILSSHPEVLGTGERKDLDVVIRQSIAESERFSLPGELTRLDKKQIAGLAEQYLQRVSSRFSFTHRFTDKMPANFFYIGLIRILFPKAKIVHCVRDPVDTCLSCYKRYFSTDGLYFTYQLEELGQYYCLYRDLMDYWHQLFPGEIYDFSYEGLIENQEKETRRLLDFCDLAWDDACLNYYDATRIVSTHSIAQVRKPLYRSSVQLWRRYTDHLQPLLQALVQGGAMTSDDVS